MSKTKGDLAWRCPSCGNENAAGMGFCMECGEPRRGLTGSFPVQAGESDKPTGTQTYTREMAPAETPQGRGRVCPACGKFDPLSNRFCVYCGASTQTAMFDRAMQSQTATLEVEPLAAPRRAVPALPPGVMIGAAAFGVVSGILVGIFAYSAFIEDMIVKSSWPAAGLVLYASPPLSQVTVKDNTARHFALGQTGPEGELTVTDLPPGSYTLILAAPGYQTFARDLQLERNKVTVIGYPQRIQLASKE
ncbi:MAG TPA: zinc ribbon domain-containing protein [Candidatus Obscuribacterales bacterium]